jgi:lipoprotein-releasing system ATP-binding protein
LTDAGTIERAHDEATLIRSESQRVVLETRGLRKTYFGKVSVPVLFGIDMKVRAQEFVAVIGQSGSGKSTLLNILGALDTPTEGTVLINGTDISTVDDTEMARLRNDEVGFIFQFHYLLDEFTCLENALMPLTIRDGDVDEADRERVIELLGRVGLGTQLSKRPDEMSGGQNQRCAIVRALANTPKIVLADEPTGNLDSRSGEEVFKLMREMNHESGVAFVMITHDDRLAQAADRILLIEDGLIHEISKVEHRKRVANL